MLHFGDVDQLVVTVDASKLPLDGPGICLEAGYFYEFHFDQNQQWKDGFIQTTPAGYCNPLNIFFKPVCRYAKYFALVGMYYYDGPDYNTSFQIQNGMGFYLREQALLKCFANDVLWAYRNNKGIIELKIRRVKAVKTTP